MKCHFHLTKSNLKSLYAKDITKYNSKQPRIEEDYLFSRTTKTKYIRRQGVVEVRSFKRKQTEEKMAYKQHKHKHAK